MANLVPVDPFNRLAKDEVVDLYLDAKKRSPLSVAAGAPLAVAVGMGCGYADAAIGDGKGSAAKSAVVGASFLGTLAFGSDTLAGKVANTVLVSSLGALGAEAGRAVRLKQAAENAKKLAAQKAAEAQQAQAQAQQKAA